MAFPDKVQDFIVHRFFEQRSNIKARFLRHVQLNKNFCNENRELRSMLAEQGSTQAAPTQIGSVSPVQVLSNNNKPGYWNAMPPPGQWDGKDPDAMAVMPR